jgi:hypothetical protein
MTNARHYATHRPQATNHKRNKKKRIRCSGSILFLEHWRNEEVHGFGSIHLESLCWIYLVNNDTSDHTRVCGSLKASLLTHPTQAITTAPGLGLLSPEVTPMTGQASACLSERAQIWGEAR